MELSREKDYVLKTIESRDVRFIRLWFVDALGNQKSFAIAPSEVENAMENGMGFDGSCISGFGDLTDSDFLAFPDPSTFQILPWRPQSNAVARMFCNIVRPDGRPFEGDSRQVLIRTLNEALDAGYTFNVGSEMEFFYFKDETGTVVLDEGGYFDLTSLDSASDLRRDTVLALESMGVSVEYSHHERGPSQHEIDLRYSDAIGMADAVMTYKQVVKEIANTHDVHASFMPKPMEGQPGNGMHIHQSLFDRHGRNAFFDPDDPDGLDLSDTAKHYLAGLLRYAPEYTLITNPLVNSYKRLAPFQDTAGCATWAPRNRSAFARIPGYRLGDEESCRIELRNPDPAANPYLAFSVILAAGMKGVHDKLELPPSCGDANLLRMTRDELQAAGYPLLPQNLGQAVQAFAASDLMRETLGDHIFDYLVRAKQEEWDSYQAHVSQWEFDHYLATV